jgi:hypothetical protein
MELNMHVNAIKHLVIKIGITQTGVQDAYKAMVGHGWCVGAAVAGPG